MDTVRAHMFVGQFGAEREPVADAPTDGATQFGVGTAQYMPPEQARGDDPDARVDVYAVGATLYHALALRPPFAAANESVSFSTSGDRMLR